MGHTGRLRVRVLLVVVTAVLGSMIASPVAHAKDGPVSADAPAGSDPFAAVNESMRARVRNDDLAGGMLLVVRDGAILDQRSFGGDTVIPIASASKWLTSATLMTLVDEGKLSLDDAVAARIVEVLTGQSFEEAFEARIARPLGMGSTRFDTFGGQRVRHPQPAGSAVSTVDDYAKFVAMMANRGTAGERRVLSTASVAAIETDQVRGIDTRGDGAVQTTGIPTYGLGVWRDVVGPDDEIRVLSGSGGYGFYPWIDRRHDSYGIVGVADLYRGADHAVPESQRQARASWRAAAKWVP